MEQDMIRLTTEKQLRIFMLPLRQKILKAMYIEGRAMTAKQLADRLSITPSSAKYHLQKLEEIGLVVLDHRMSINGIIASFYRTTGANVSIGNDRFDDFCGERDAFVKNMLADAYDGYKDLVEKHRDRKNVGFIGDIVSGIVHLTESQANEIHKAILQFLHDNDQASMDTKPWHFVLVGYRADLNDSEGHCNE